MNHQSARAERAPHEEKAVPRLSVPGLDDENEFGRYRELPENTEQEVVVIPRTAWKNAGSRRYAGRCDCCGSVRVRISAPDREYIVVRHRR